MKLHRALLTSAAILAASSLANATITFVDSSFENGGGLTLGGPNYVNDVDGFNKFGVISGHSANIWNVKNLTTGTDGLLETSTSYRGAASPTPVTVAGVTGNQFFSAGRSSRQQRGLMQYTDLGVGNEISGVFDVSIDYWSFSAGDASTVGASAPTRMNFVAFAFNDPDLVGYRFENGTIAVSDMPNLNTNGVADPIRGRANDTSTVWVKGLNYAYVESGYVEYTTVSAATGFQTLQLELDLGAANYQYVGVAFGFFADNNTSDSVGEQIAIDNLQFNAVPEPSSVLLGGLGALLLLRRRR